VENRLHCVRDVVLAEDLSQIPTGSGPAVMAVLLPCPHNCNINNAEALSSAAIGLRRRRDGCGLPRWDEVAPRCQPRGPARSTSRHSPRMDPMAANS
jgi:hypothetical protein